MDAILGPEGIANTADSRKYDVKQNGLTILAEIISGHEATISRILDDINRDLSGNGMIDFKAITSVHFASWVMLPAYLGSAPRLLLETNYDGDLEAHLDELIRHGAKALDLIYAECVGYPRTGTKNSERVKAFLKAHAVKSAAFYVGLPGRSVGDIRNAMIVSREARDFIDAQRRKSAANPHGDDAGFERLTADQIKAELVHHYRHHNRSIRPMRSPVNRHKLRISFWIHVAIIAIVAALIWPLLLIAACAIPIAARFREIREERAHMPDPAARPIAAQAASGQAPGTQNHMCTVTEIKPGRLRMFLLKSALAAANLASRWFFIFGKLGPVPTIHFARWTLIDNSRRLLFLSNYDGIWTSYLGEFADQRWGVNAIWSNTIGFPRTKFLFWDGARDLDAFERNVRAHLLSTQVFYRAYPGYASQAMRRDLDYRDDLAAAITAADRIEAAANRVDLDRADVQGIVASGYNHLNHARFLLMRVLDTGKARSWLCSVVDEVTTAARREHADPKPDCCFNIAFTANGLTALGIPPETIAEFSEEFRDGMTREGASDLLGDTGDSAPEHWHFGSGERRCDILLMLYGRTPEALAALSVHVYDKALSDGALGLICEAYSDRTDSREPFGFRDGISQPPVIGLVHQPPWREQELIKTGEFLLGYENEYGLTPFVPAIPNNYDPADHLPPHPAHPRDRKAFGLNGSYLLARKLAQDVDAFQNFVEENSRDSAGRVDPYQCELLAAKMMGRWRGGAPLVIAPDHDIPALGIRSAINNSFLYRPADPDGSACPVGSHIRRANPRDSLDFSPRRSFELSKRHRIIRRGRKYSSGSDNDDTKSREQGILFIAINADIRRQFEFLQQAWINNPGFMGLHSGRDPIVGDNDGTSEFTIQGKAFNRHVHGLKRFVTVRGGAYFFLPGIAALKCISGYPPSRDSWSQSSAPVNAS